jgi:hypothetical protein
MAAALRISGHRMSVRPSGPVVLFTAERAYADALRQWSKDEAHRLALLVAWSRYSEQEAHRELTAFLVVQAEKAGIPHSICSKVAASMLDEAGAELDERYNTVLQRMIDAASHEFALNRRAPLQAAMAAADIAEAEKVPPDLIDSAFRIARWRTRKGA